MILFEIVMAYVVIGSLYIPFDIWELVEHARRVNNWFFLKPLASEPMTEVQQFILLRDTFLFMPRFLIVIYFIARSGKLWAEFGLVRPGSSEQISSDWLRGCFWAGISILIACGLLQNILLPLVQFGRLPVEIEWPGIIHFWGQRSLLQYGMMIISVSLVGFGEELFHRAYMIPRLQHLGLAPKWALVISTVMFALGHSYQGLDGIIAALIIGALFGSVFLSTSRLWPIAIAHALFDFVMMPR